MFNQRTSVLDYLRKPVDPKELVRKWQSDLRAEVRKTERSIMGVWAGVDHTTTPHLLQTEIEREKKKTEKAIRDAAKRNDMASAKVVWVNTVATSTYHAQRRFLPRRLSTATKPLAGCM